VKCDGCRSVGQGMVDRSRSGLAVHREDAGAACIKQPEFVQVDSRGMELSGGRGERATGDQIDQLAVGCLGSESGYGCIGGVCVVECNSAALPVISVQMRTILGTPCWLDGRGGRELEY